MYRMDMIHVAHASMGYMYTMDLWDTCIMDRFHETMPRLFAIVGFVPSGSYYHRLVSKPLSGLSFHETLPRLLAIVGVAPWGSCNQSLV